MTFTWRHVVTIAVLGLAATTVLNPTAQAEKAVRSASGAEAVPGSYLVVFKDGASASAQALSDQYLGKLGDTFSSALNGFSVRDLSEQQARRLAAHPAVDYVERDVIGQGTGTQSDPVWGLDRIDDRDLPLDKSYVYPTTASNVTAYVLDSGLLTTHSEFEGRASDGYDFVDKDSVANDCYGHGTHVAGTIAGKTYGVAKQAKVVGVRVINCNNSVTSTNLVSAIDWVTKNGVKPGVVNLSLGFNGTITSIHNAIKKSINAGFTYVVSAGNDGKDACGQTPANLAEAITVGASDKADKRSSWNNGYSSNYGKCLDIWAPGTDIVSSFYTNDTSTKSYNGTSQASPHVAGAAALHLSANTGSTQQQVRDALVNNATKDKLTDVKTGSPNALLFVS